MRVLVTGHQGYIGTVLTQVLGTTWWAWTPGTFETACSARHRLIRPDVVPTCETRLLTPAYRSA